MTWASSDSQRAPVSTNGTVRALQAGTVTITASSEGKTGSTTVRISPVPVRSIAVAPETGSVFVGQSLTITAVPKDSTGAVLNDRPVTWTSSDNAVATVSATGVVTGIAPGTAVITGASEGASGSSTMQVLAVGPRLELSVTGLPSGVTSADVRIYNDDFSINTSVAVSLGTPVRFNSLPQGRYTIAAGAVQMTANGINYIFLPPAGQETQQITIGAFATTVTTLPYGQRTGAIAVTASGLPQGTRTACTLIFPPPGVQGISGGGAQTTSGTTETIQAYGTGVGTFICGPVTVNGVQYEPSPAQQSVDVPASMTPATVTVAYSPPAAGDQVRLELSASGLPAGVSSAQVRVYNGDFSVNTTATVVPGTPVQFTSLPPGQYTIAAGSVSTTINGINYVYLPPAAQETQQVTVAATSKTVVALPYVQRTGAIAVTANGLPVGTKTACTLIFPPPGVQGIVGGGAQTTSGGTETVQAYGTGTATFTCSPVTVSGILYEASPVQQSVFVPASTTPATVSVTYAPPVGPDMTPPRFEALTVSPLSVDVTTGARTVVATARVTDTQRGVIGIDFLLNAPAGGIQTSCQTRAIVSGTPADGTWSCTATVPLGAQPGDWTIALNAWDAAQNMEGLRTDGLIARGWPTKVSVVSQNPDLTPPTFQSLTVSPLAVNVTTGAQTVVATARITDAERGVIAMDFLLTAPGAGGQVGCQTRTPASGTTADGTWSCTATIPFGARPGDWTIALNGYDAAQNMEGIRTEHLVARGLPSTVSVTSDDADVTPPTFQSLTVTPLDIDVTADSQMVVATARITDTQRGVIGLDFLLTAPTGGGQRSCQTRTLLSGTSADGIWSCSVLIPRGSWPGDWTIALNGWDAAQNMEGLRTEQLAAHGWATKVAVTSR